MKRKIIRDRRMSTTYAATTLLTVLSLTHVALAQEASANTATPQAVPAADGTLPPTTYDATVPPPPPPAEGWHAPVLEPTTTKTTFPNRSLLLTGAVLLGASYGASVLVAAGSSGPENEKLYYPVVGPWMDLDDRNCGLRSCSSTKTLYQGLLIGDGVVQGVGALTMLLSLVIPETTTRFWYLIGNDSLRIAPQLGAVTGVGAMGSF